jgi:hypothetical protein
MDRVFILEPMACSQWTIVAFITTKARLLAVACTSQALLQPCRTLNFQQTMPLLVLAPIYFLAISPCLLIHLQATLPLMALIYI